MMSCKTQRNASKTVGFIEDILGALFPDTRYNYIVLITEE